MVQILLRCLMVLALLWPSAAASAQVVRVGLVQGDTSVLDPVFVQQYYSAYLSELSKLSENRYDLTLVPIDECINMLKNGDIDMLLPLETPSDIPRAKISYSTSTLGFDVIGLYGRRDQISFSARNLTAIEGARIGLITNRPANATFDDFVRGMGLNVERYYYRTQTQLLAALASGSIDLVVDTATNADASEELVLAFDTVPVMFGTMPASHAYIDDLETALRRLRYENPRFAEELDTAFRRRIDHQLIHFTLEESRFLSSLGTLKIAIYEDNAPFIYFDPATGEPRGIYPDILRLIGAQLGISIDYVRVGSYQTARRLVESGEATAMLDVFTNDALSDSFYFTNPIYTLNYNFVGKFSTRPDAIANTRRSLVNLDSDAMLRVSLNERAPSFGQYIAHEFPNWIIVPAVSSSDTLNLVDQKYADVALIRDIDLTIDRPMLVHPDLPLVPGINVQIPLSLALSQHASPLLQVLLNKAIMQLSPETITAITQQHTVMTRPPLTLEHILAYYPMEAGLAIGVVLLIVVVSGVGFYHSRQMHKNQELLKSKNAILLGTIERLKEVTASEHQYKAKAATDALTGVFNKSGIEMAAAAVLNSPPEEHHCHALFIIDLDHFKEANDTYGHKYGDDILKKFSTGLRKIVRSHDALGRFGGDEFILVLGNLPEPIVYSIARRITEVARELGTTETGESALSASIGIALAPRHGTSYDELFPAADAALYQVKENGRNGWQIAATPAKN